MDGAEEVVEVEVRRCVERLFVSAEMSIEQSFGDTTAMARSMASGTSGSMCSESFSECCASSVEAEEEDDVGGIACGGRDAEEEAWSSNSSRASKSICWRAERGVPDGGVVSRASDRCGRCCGLDAEDVAEMLGTRSC